MYYPSHFNADDIMKFEYEYNRYLDLQNPDSIEAINAKLQEIAHESTIDSADSEWDDKQPDEFQEWYDFDPDC